MQRGEHNDATGLISLKALQNIARYGVFFKDCFFCVCVCMYVLFNILTFCVYSYFIESYWDEFHCLSFNTALSLKTNFTQRYNKVYFYSSFLLRVKRCIFWSTDNMLSRDLECKKTGLVSCRLFLSFLCSEINTLHSIFFFYQSISRPYMRS